MTIAKVLTEPEAKSLQTERKQWSQAFAAALREWCGDNGYTPFNKLKAELEISDGKWKHLLDDAGGVAGDVTIYARLYLRTGLPEVDPRTIPSRVYYAARVGRYYEGKRAWTDQEYENWKKDYQLPPPLTESPKEILRSREVIPPNGTGREPEAEPQTLGALFDRFLAIQEERIVSRVVKALGQKREDNGDIGKQADQLFHSLEKYLDGTPEDRDRLMARFGKTHLSRLFSLLRDLSSEDRETVLQLNQHRRK